MTENTRNWLYIEGSVDSGFTLFGLFTEERAQAIADHIDANEDAHRFYTTAQLRTPQAEHHAPDGDYAVVAGTFYNGFVFYGPFATNDAAADCCGGYANEHDGEAVVVVINGTEMLALDEDFDLNG